VPNLKFLYREALNKDGYAPAFMFYSMGIAYNSEKFKSADIPDVTSWKDLWNPKLAGRVAMSDLSIVQGRDALIAASMLEGGDERSLPAMEKGLDRLATIKAHSYTQSSATLEALLRSGDVWVAPWINGRAWGMIDGGFPLRFVLPKDGAFAGWGSAHLVRGTKYPKQAQAYINSVLDPLGQLGQANEIPYGPANALLEPVLAAYPELSKKFPASAKEVSELYRPDWRVFNDNYLKLIDLWNRKIVSR
jgi:putative spermidine/putrescine transport system substrate-binding protein